VHGGSLWFAGRTAPIVGGRMIDVAFTRAQLRPARVTVVIDALRATATAVAALAAGYRQVLFTAGIEEARLLRGPGRVLAGEVRCLMPAGFDQGNSPVDAAQRRGDELVLATTNGTPAIITATRTSETVLLASMLNLAATIRRLRDAGADVQLVCAGADGAVALEDVYVAGRIALELRGGPTDAALAAQATCRAYGDPLSAFAASAGAARLHAAGLGDDVEYCARESVLDVVAIAAATKPGQAAATLGEYSVTASATRTAEPRSEAAPLRSAAAAFGQLTTTPNGAAPVGSATGAPASGASEPPSTANPLSASPPLSTTHRVEPSGLRRASCGPTADTPANGTLASSCSVPSKPIA
jgi:2-phosphosulfolactate phosphatase